MDQLREGIVRALKEAFPTHEASIRPFTALLDEQTDVQISYPSTGMLVCILPITEAPDDIPWELRAHFGLVVTLKAASAIERDKLGWKLCMQVAQVVYRNCWGIERMNITPAVITGIQKNEARTPDGAPTGINYWTILFYNYVKFEAVV